MLNKRRAFIWHYGVAVVSVVVAISVRLLLEPLLGLSFPFTTLLLAVVAAAWAGGFGPALVAVALGVLGADYFLLEPSGSLLQLRLHEWVGLGLYACSGVGIALLGASMHTARERAEGTESEERFRTMANSMPQLAWIAQADGSIFWYNERWYEYTGTTAEQMTGWGWQRVHDPEVLPKVVEKWQAAIDSGQPFEMEFPLRGADGRFRIFLTRVQPMKNAQGGVAHWFGTNTDVDELKRLEKSLRATQTRLNSTLFAGSIGTWTWDIANDSLVGDEFTARAFSLAADEAAQGLPAAAFLQAVVEEDQSRVSAALARTIETCGDYDLQYRVRQKNGAFLWLQARGRVEGDGAGRAVYFHGAVMDITARKLAEAAVRASEEYFRFLNDLSEATRALADPEQIMAVMARMLGEHLRVSRCAYADVEPDGERFSILHDYTAGCASTVGHYELSLFGPRAVAAMHGGQTLIIRDVAVELSPGEGTEMFNAIGVQAIICCPLVKEGGLRAMMAVHQVTPRDWQPGEIAMVQDVVERCWATIERRHAEEKIHLLNATLERRVNERTAQLESANQELEAFSYSVSHDLRAPLRAVDGFSRAVEEDYGSLLPAEGRRYLQTIRSGAQRMGLLIDDLLTFSRLSRLPLTRQPVDAHGQARATLDELLAGYEGRAIEVQLGELPPCQGDPALLKQVWMNLVSNALKYTAKKAQAVVEIGAREEQGGTVYFVRDNGTGFDMRYAGKLFGVFQRLHRQEEFEGTGVGLAIVQRIIHRHGGRVWAEAALDRGATFYFTLEGSPQL